MPFNEGVAQVRVTLFANTSITQLRNDVLVLLSVISDGTRSRVSEIPRMRMHGNDR